MAIADIGLSKQQLSYGILVERQAIGHHGELVQGVFEDECGGLHRGLITVPLDGLNSFARILLDKTGSLNVHPAEKTKALRAVQLTLKHLGLPKAGAELRLESNIPIGHGFGSSTADVIASIRAAAAALGTKLPPSAISRLAVAAEIAADATAYESEAVLFAHREGEVIEHLGGALPPFFLIGFKHSSADVVDTLQLPPARYTREEIQSFRVLRGMAARAVQHQNLRLLSRAATVSASINQRYLPKQGFELVMRLAERYNTLGVQVAHSGSLFGLMVDPSLPDIRTLLRTVARELGDAGFIDIRLFRISGAGGANVL